MGRQLILILIPASLGTENGNLETHYGIIACASIHRETNHSGAHCPLCKPGVCQDEADTF